MKKRMFALLNFLALNVLFFAIYLNFIQKDTNILPAVSASANRAANSVASNDLDKTASVAALQKIKTTRAEN